MGTLTVDVPADSALGELAPHIAQHFGEVATAVEAHADGDRIRIDVPAQVGMVENTRPGELKLAFGDRDPQILSRFVFDESGQLLTDNCRFNVLLCRDGNRI